MSREPVILLDRTSGQQMDAVLDTDAPLVCLVDAELVWSPYRLGTIRQFLASGGTGALPQHCHWNWATKALAFDRDKHRVVAVEAANEVQGLMWMWLRDYQARLAPHVGQPLVYVDYLEAAPWNTREYAASPRFKGIGTQLLKAAVKCSRKEGFGGRMGLHALPQSEEFYAGACGMCSMGADPRYHNLVYFEFSEEAATAFMGGGGETP